MSSYNLDQEHVLKGLESQRQRQVIRYLEVICKKNEHEVISDDLLIGLLACYNHKIS